MQCISFPFQDSDIQTDDRQVDNLGNKCHFLLGFGHIDSWNTSGPSKKYISFPFRILTYRPLADKWTIQAIHIISCQDSDIQTAGRQVDNVGNTYHFLLVFCEIEGWQTSGTYRQYISFPVRILTYRNLEDKLAIQEIHIMSWQDYDIQKYGGKVDNLCNKYHFLLGC